MASVTWAPIVLSLQVAVVATAISGGIGLALAEWLTHRRAWLRAVLDALLVAPLVFPPTVLGYYLLVLLGHHGPVGRLWERVFDSPLVFSRAGAFVAASLTSLPVVVQAARAALEAVDPRLLDAARSLGATPLRTFWRVRLPLASRGVAAGLALGFARALGDFGVTLMVAGNMPGETQTAALAIYDAMSAGRDEQAAALVGVMTVLAFAFVLGASVLARRPHA